MPEHRMWRFHGDIYVHTVQQGAHIPGDAVAERIQSAATRSRLAESEDTCARRDGQKIPCTTMHELEKQVETNTTSRRGVAHSEIPTSQDAGAHADVLILLPREVEVLKPVW